jgi:hypothetical protein
VPGLPGVCKYSVSSVTADGPVRRLFLPLPVCALLGTGSAEPHVGGEPDEGLSARRIDFAPAVLVPCTA